MVNVLPIDIPKKRLAHDLLRVRGPTAEPLVGLAGEQLLQDGNAVAGHMDGVERLVSKDSVIDLVFVFTAEGGLLEEHLID